MFYTNSKTAEARKEAMLEKIDSILRGRINAFVHEVIYEYISMQCEITETKRIIEWEHINNDFEIWMRALYWFAQTLESRINKEK